MPGAFASLAPMVAIVFLGFMSVGASLPPLSLFVHATLGFSTTVVGWVIGIQSLVTILVRHRSGTVADQSGPRLAVLLGLPCAALAGVLYAISAMAPLGPEPRLAALLIGRVLLGVGESLFITGTMSWGIARAGAARTGLVMSWQGIAMFAAIGLGAPLGLGIQDRFGFTSVALLTVLTPLAACAIALVLPPVPAGGGERVPFYRVIGLIWRPGVVLTLATVPFATMATFLALYYAARGWNGAGSALAAFGIGYVAVRLVGSHWPGRFGGTLVAGISLTVEAIGQVVLWLAPTPGLALAGAALTGIGFSLVFPAMGVEATKRVPPALRGRAVGNFLAFFDMAIGLTGLVLGVVAGDFGLSAVFLAGVAATLASLALLQGVRRMAVPA